MTNIACKSCGGSVTRKGNYYICDFCRSKWMIDSGNDVHAVERANAWMALRNNDFEKAAELFEEILVKDSASHEAYWGRALALNGIVYVTDYNENKKVPTCNNITEESFLENKDVQKAISIAPTDIKESYQKQAEQIEKIRLEWLNKASKEPAYDIFISFKDSDREHGIERTQDSIDVQDLYTALVQKGYNVFFSRVTLRDKVSEQYEPYIYNALKTAKVMIVFGEKAEYFNAVWVKNEWSRFKTRLEKGEKHKNSLITVYKNVNPYEIPVALTGGRQAIDYSIPSNFEVLMNHVKRVIEESNQAVHLDRIEIKGGQMAKKSANIKTETLQTRELGKGAIAKTSISEKQMLDLAHSYLRGKQWDDANKLLDDLLFNNPNLADAIWYKLQSKYNAASGEELFKKIGSFTQEDYNTIARILNCAEKDLANYILNSMYALCKNVSETINITILNTILPFNYEERKIKIDQAFTQAIYIARFSVFKLLLKTIDTNDVDTYIKYNLDFAKTTRSAEIKLECLNNVISVDEGNIEAQKMFLTLYLDRDDIKNTIKTLETILKYSSDHKKVVYDLLVQIKNALNSNEDCLVLKEFLKYYPGELVEIKEFLVDASYVMIKQGYFEHAKYLLSLTLSVDENNPRIYWGLCRVKTKSRTDSEIVKSEISLKQVPEYTKYLTMVSEVRRQECFNIVKEQEKTQQNKINSKKVKRLAAVFSIILSFVVASIILLQSVVIPTNKYNKALGFLRDKDDVSAYQVLSEIPTFKDSSTLIIEIKEKAKIKAKEYADNNDFESAYNTLANVGINESEFSSMKQYKAMAEGKWVQAIEYGLYDLIIPEGVTEIKGYEFDNSPLKSIKIPNSVTSIGSNAFAFCHSLTSVTIGDGVTSIGNNAFYGCDSLTSIVIGDGVTSIGSSAFVGCSSLTSIAIGDSVTSIGNSAFVGCSSLTSVVIGDSVTSISNSAFSGCSKLTSIEIPNSVKSIGDSAFFDCSKLTSITIPNSVTSIGYEAFYNCTKLTSVTIPDSVTSIGSSAFSGCRSLTSITIPNSVTIIGSSAFYNCAKLTSVTIPDSVTSIGSSAFEGCDSLTSIVIGDSVTSIGEDAFYGCDSLTNVVIPDSVTSIGMEAFSGCSKLESITLPFVGASLNGTYNKHFGYIFGASNSSYNDDYVPTSLKEVIITGGASIGGYAFRYCDSLTSVVIGEDVTSIGDSAFESCTSLTSVVIGDSVTSIGSSAFSGCYRLVEVVNKSPHIIVRKGSSSNGYVGNYALAVYNSDSGITESQLVNDNGYIIYTNGSEKILLGYNGQATDLVLPNYITKVNAYAFYNCSKLTSVVIGDGVTSIGSYAFKGCSTLTKAEIAYSVEEISNDAFYGCSNLKIYCEVQSKPAGWYSSWNSSNCPVYWGYNTVKTHSEYDYVITGESVRLVKYKGGNTNVIVPSVIDGYTVTSFSDIFKGNTKITSINIRDGITNIGDSAFNGCTALSSVTIPNSVTSVGSSAFSGCTSLISVAIPDSLTSINEKTFYNCTSLTSIVIPNSVTSIGNSAFSGCNSLTSVTIGNGVTSIGSSAFSSCDSLTSIVIPDSVTSVGSSAFSGCKFENISAPMLILSEISKTNLKEVIITSGSTICSNEFKNCSNLTNVTIGNSVTNIGEAAFYGCTALTSVTIPDSVTSIGKEAFRQCTSLKSVSIGNGVTSISYGMLDNCYSLTSVTIGNSVTSIGFYAFYNCNKLASLNISKNVTNISNYAFSDCDSLTIYTEWESRPTGWGVDWNKTLYNYSDYIPVVWGYTYE